VRNTVEIIGEATGSDFVGYRLDFGLGTNPVDWLPITEGTSAVQGDVLGVWETVNLAEGLYTLRLTVLGRGGTALAVVRRVRVER
jgi:hypothetical protein